MADTGAFPNRDLRASATLDQSKCYPLAGTWQVAFLGEAEPRAARPGRHAPASDASRLSASHGCQIAPVALFKHQFNGPQGRPAPRPLPSPSPSDAVQDRSPHVTLAAMRSCLRHRPPCSPRPLPWPRCLHPCLRAHAFRSPLSVTWSIWFAAGAWRLSNCELRSGQARGDRLKGDFSNIGPSQP